MKRNLLSILIFILITSSVIVARDMTRLNRNIEKDRQVKTVHLDSDIGAARFNIKTHDGGDIFEASVRYDADKVNSDIEYELSGSSAEIFLSSSQRRKKFDMDSDDNRWKSSLSTDYEWDIDLDLGFAESKIDLSGLPLIRFKLDVGASEMEVKFDRPNPVRMKRFTIDAGAGEIDLIGLGYANFERFDLDAGAGELYIDFSGMTKGRHVASIDAGVGELRIQLPEDFPVRIDVDDSWLSSVEISGNDLDEIDDNLFETDDFDNSKDGLDIRLDIGIGSVIISQSGNPDQRIIYRSDRYYGNHRKAPLPERVLFQNGYGSFIPQVLAVPALPAMPALPDVSALSTLLKLPTLPGIPALTEITVISALSDIVPVTLVAPVAPIAPLPEVPEFDHNSEHSRRKVE